jgi:tetratricopeptide (TPR) repeat protein
MPVKRISKPTAALRGLPLILLIIGFLFGNPVLTHGRADESKDLFQKVIELYRQGKYHEAIPFAQRLLELDRQELGNEDVETATALNNLAELYRLSGDYTKAEPLCSEALRIRRKVLGDEAPF